MTTRPLEISRPFAVPRTASRPADIERHDALWIAIFALLIAALASTSPLFGHWTEGTFGLLARTAAAFAIIGYGAMLAALGIVWLGEFRLKESPGLIRSFGKAWTGGLSGAALALIMLPRSPRYWTNEVVPWIFLGAMILLLTLMLVKEGELSLRDLRWFLIGEYGRSRREILRDYISLAKPGLNSLVLVTTLVGYMMASAGGTDWWRGLRLLVATALVAGGASALNQVIEREFDARMPRTADRPLPAGRIAPPRALTYACLLSLTGLIGLGLTVNISSAALAALTLATYLFLYTPMKRVSTLSTLAGAVSGALPPLIGWVAAGHGVGSGGIVLFFILFFWQIPHFLAISWMYREQYGAAGFPMYSVLDAQGRATAGQSFLYGVGLLLASLAAAQPGMSGAVYGAGAAVLGLGLLILAARFGARPARSSARLLFFATLAYLPLLLCLMLLDRA